VAIKEKLERGDGEALLRHRPRLDSPPCIPHQAEIVELLGSGLADKQIADKLTISKHTVAFHLRTIFYRLEARNRTHAVMIWGRHKALEFTFYISSRIGFHARMKPLLFLILILSVAGRSRAGVVTLTAKSLDDTNGVSELTIGPYELAEVISFPSYMNAGNRLQIEKDGKTATHVSFDRLMFLTVLRSSHRRRTSHFSIDCGAF
jgi:DNA-binding CsgD family transcriptional regulator